MLTHVQPLASHAQLHACAEVGRLKLPAFENVIQQRVAYVEIGLSGLTPHFADRGRGTVAKAVAELDALVGEIEAVAARPAMSVREKGAA